MDRALIDGHSDDAIRAATYTRVAIAFHWVIALAIVGQLALGWRLHDIEGTAKFAAYQLHKSIGLSILVLSVGRLLWRLTHRPPAEAGLPRWQAVISTTVHASLYAIMIGLPLTGWLMVSTSRIAVPTRPFGVFTWPAFPGTTAVEPSVRQALNGVGHEGHEWLVWTAVALLVLHLGAVVKHQMIDRDRVFNRMAPGARTGWRDGRFLLVAGLGVAAFLVGWVWPGAAGRSMHVVQASAVPVSQPAVPAPLAPTAAPVAAPAQTAPATQIDNDAIARAWTVRSGTLNFATSWSGTPITGSFRKFTTKIVFGPKALDRSSINVRVNIASVAASDAQQEEALPGSDWFDASAHPEAVFTSDRIRATGKDRYVATGILTVRGVKRRTELPFALTIKDDTASASGSLTIDRTAFGVGQGEWAATDQIPRDVKVRFTIQARAATP
jgi:cytochrome b561/polyisoprenoid-binding protein YceI